MQPSFDTKRLIWILILTVVFIISYYLRWAYINNTSIVQPVVKDAYAYTMIAQNLVNNHVFSSNKSLKGQSTPESRPPGYPFFLAIIVWFTDSFNSFYFTTLWIQSIIGAMTVLLTYTLARFLLPKVWSLSAALLIMVSPHMIATSAFLLSECVFTFILLLAIVFFVWAVKSGKLLLFGFSGIFLGVGIFIRPVLGMFPVLCVIVAYLFNSKQPRRVIYFSLVIFIVTSYSFQLSWSVWKKIKIGHEQVAGDLLKTAFLCGTYPQITYQKYPGMPHREDPHFNTLMDKKYDEISVYLLKQFKNEPLKYVTWWCFGKPVMYWSWKIFYGDGINFYPVYYSWFDKSPVMKILKTTMLILHPVIVILAAVSVFLYGKVSLKSRKVPGNFCYIICFVLLAHFTLMFMVLAPFPRYSIPMGPELFILAVFSVWQIIQTARSIKQSKLSKYERNYTNQSVPC